MGTMAPISEARVLQPFEGGTGCESGILLADLPSTDLEAGTICLITDGSDDFDCGPVTTGSSNVLCVWTGSSWRPLWPIDSLAGPSSSNQFIVSTSGNLEYTAVTPSCDNSTTGGALLSYSNVSRDFSCEDSIKLKSIASGTGSTTDGIIEWESVSEQIVIGKGGSAQVQCNEDGNCLSLLYDTEYLRLDASNDPLTSELEIDVVDGTNALLVANDGATATFTIFSNTNSVHYVSDGVSGNFASVNRIAGDTFNRFTTRTDGQIQWGDGSSTSNDVSISRTAASEITLDGVLVIEQTDRQDDTVLLTQTSTSTSADLNGMDVIVNVSPASAKTATVDHGARITIQPGTAQELNTELQALQARVLHEQVSQVDTMRGADIRVDIGGVSAVAATYDSAIGMSQAVLHRTSADATTETIAGRFRLVVGSTGDPSGSAGASSGIFDLNPQGSNPTRTIADYANIRVTYTDVSGDTATTITELAGIVIEGIHTDPTVTNYDQLRLEAMPDGGTRRVAIRQLGTEGHNRLEGSTTIGDDAAPTARLDVIQSDGTKSAALLINSADLGTVPIMTLRGTRVTPTDEDTLRLIFQMNDDGAAAATVGEMRVSALDVSAGTVDGRYSFYVASGSSDFEMLRVQSTAAGVKAVQANPTQADVDFQVHGDGTNNIVHTDAANDCVNFGSTTLCSTTTQVAIDGFADKVQLNVQGNGTQSAGNDILVVETSAGLDLLSVGVAEIVFNEGSGDVDFAIDGDTTADIFRCDAGTEACAATESMTFDGGTGSFGVIVQGSTGGCVIYRDTDDGGFTECVALDGTQTCTVDADGVCDGGADSAADWSASFVAWWDLDESSGTRVATGGACSAGSTCDLTDNNTVTQNTTTEVEGSAAAQFTGANNEYLSCNNGTCDALTDITGNITFGCWSRADSNVSNHGLIHNTWSNNGYFLRISTNSSGRYDCGVSQGTASQQADTGTSSAVTDTNTHVVCALNDTVELQGFVDGVPAGTPNTSLSAMTAPTTQSFQISRSATSNDWDGMLDECFVIDDFLTDAEICRICSCQIDGSLCTCAGASYLDNGRNSQTCSGGTCTGDSNTCTTNADCGSCSSCTLPDCDAAAP